MTEDATEPLAAVGDPGRSLPSQIARFGELASRDLLARAFVMLRQRGSDDPQLLGDPRDCQPLTTGEQLEMLALRAAIADDHGAAAPAGTAGTGHSGHESPARPTRLWRPAPPGVHRVARHRRVPDTGPRPAP